ncbi:MAG TPA: hypothetical protein VMS76_08010 [Planctomycetota bacterium]|nr:hypothetical protein [Planctomycetota bacterium]
MKPSPRAAATTAAVLSLLAMLAACTGNGGGGGVSFQPVTAKLGTKKVAVAFNTRVVIRERWLAFLADELTSGGTDFNNDGDAIDSIAAVVNMVSKKQTMPAPAGLDDEGVQAQELEIIGSGSGGQVYLVTDESKDGRDWDGDGMQDALVLLHWSESAGVVSFVARLESSTVHVLAVKHPTDATQDRLYFSEELAVPPVPPETSLRYVQASQPTVKIVVNAANPATSGQVLHLLAADSGLLFLFQDEVAEARDFNGDGDQLDDHVLALLDGRDPSAMVLNVGLAVRGDDAPVRALRKGTSTPADWVVAFLVNEAAQGATNFNDPALFGPSWQPPQCAGQADIDTADDVLHYLEYSIWSPDPVANPPVNTGLVGVDRVLALKALGSTPKYFVATISFEADEGTCSLNGDADQDDRILRWVEVMPPVPPVVAPFTNVLQLVALKDLPGGTHGVSDLNGRWLAVVDEAADNRDHDGDGQLTHDLVAWLNPAPTQGSPAWVFDHTNGNQCGQAGIQPVGASWMSERAERDRVLVGLQEAVLLKLIPNSPCQFSFGRDVNGDGDALDTIPTFGLFVSKSAGVEMDFPGPAIAASASNAGIVIANGVGFYRVDEAADNRNWNQASGMDDFVLFRTTVATIQNSNFISTLNNIPDRPAVETGGNVGAAFIADEAMADVDLNGDGDKTDLVLRWMRIGP